jgi:hypothetical protein
MPERSWTEVRLRGQPNPLIERDGFERPFPPYDFTFRDDRTTWKDMPRVVAIARAAWTDVEVTTRHVTVVETEWQPVDPDRLPTTGQETHGQRHDQPS